VVRAFVLRYWVSDPEGIHLIYPESRQLPGGVAEVDSGYMYIRVVGWFVFSNPGTTARRHALSKTLAQRAF
jgi:hypothetical protein